MEVHSRLLQHQNALISVQSTNRMHKEHHTSRFLMWLLDQHGRKMIACNDFLFRRVGCKNNCVELHCNTLLRYYLEMKNFYNKWSNHKPGAVLEGFLRFPETTQDFPSTMGAALSGYNVS